MDALRKIVLLGLGWAAVGCTESSSPAWQPTPDPRPAVEPALVVFTDPTTGFSTSDVYDAEGNIVRFNDAAQLIWVANGTRYSEGIVVVDGWSADVSGFPANQNYIGRGPCDYCTALEVVFGTRHGERRAYLTPNPFFFHREHRVGRVEVSGSLVVITYTSVPVPEV